MKNEEIAALFAAGTTKNSSLNKALHICRNGEAIFSYWTCLAERLEDGTYLLNDTRYSVTSSRHFGEVGYALRQAGKTYRKVKDVPFGASTLR